MIRPTSNYSREKACLATPAPRTAIPFRDIPYRSCIVPAAILPMITSSINRTPNADLFSFSDNRRPITRLRADKPRAPLRLRQAAAVSATVWVVFEGESPVSAGDAGDWRWRGQPGFFDIEERLKALSAAGDPLERLSAGVEGRPPRGAPAGEGTVKGGGP